MATHEKYMQRCVDLALKAGKNTKANPMVGAVLVYDDRIIGEGYHQRYGEAHAEVNALHSVKATDRHLIPQSTLYVSLEPCFHVGKTPPCVDLIIREHIPKVVIGTTDPNPLVAGKSIEKLTSIGVDVTLLESDSCAQLLRKFRCNLAKKSYVILKWAQSKDGYLGIKGNRTAISNEFSRILVHKYRSDVDGILIGYHTALIDNPLLDTRAYGGDNPIRIILDREATLPKDLLCFTKDDHYLRVCQSVPVDAKGNYILLDKWDDLNELRSKLFDLGICSVLVEGGQRVLQKFIDQSAWDEAIVIKGEITLQDISTLPLVPAPNVVGKLQERMSLGNDEIIKIY